MHMYKHNPTEKAESDLVAEIANVVQKKDLAREITNHDERDSTNLVRDRIQSEHGEESWEKEHTGGGLGVNFIQ